MQDALLRQLVTAHLPVDADRLHFEPIRTGKHNRSYYASMHGQLAAAPGA